MPLDAAQHQLEHVEAAWVGLPTFTDSTYTKAIELYYWVRMQRIIIIELEGLTNNAKNILKK